MKKLTLLLLAMFLCTIGAQPLKSVYVLSEGGMAPGSSKLSMLNVQSGDFTQSIFTPDNIGPFPDGLFLDGNTLYLSEQGNYGGTGKVYKLDSLGTVVASAEVGTNPFSLTKANDKVYITNGPASNVSVLNASDLSFVKDITVGVYPQEIVSNDSFAFVANTSTWGGDSDSTVSVISTSLDSVIATITVKLNPSSLALTDDDHLLIGCPGDETKAMIYKISLNDFAKVDSFTIPTYGFGGSLAIDNENKKAYFVASFNDIIELDLIAKTTKRVVQPTEATYVYGYNYDAVNSVHYLADAKDFSANGSLLSYNSEGTLLNTYETGIAPKRVVLHYSDAITSIADDAIATNFRLDQNYPNPFNPTTNISYQVKKAGNVTITIYNIIGEKMAVLVNEVKQAGNYQFSFDGSNLASGIYFYTMNASGFTSTKKMILSK